MLTDALRKKLESNEQIICAFMRIPDPMIAELMAVSGVELIIIDCEHFQFHVETVANVIRAADIYGCSCFVRVSVAEDRHLIANALDMGAAGILLTDAEGAGDVRKAVDAMKYAPEGHRGVCTDSRMSRFGTMVSLQEHAAYYNHCTVLAVVIETMRSIEELDEILAIPQVDIVSVGDADLSYALGHPGDTKHPKQLSLRNHIYEKILAAGKTALDKTPDKTAIKRAYQEGKRVFYIASDETLIMNGIRDIIKFGG